MPHPKKRPSKGRKLRRRAHHALKPKQTVVCTSCDAPVLPHRACSVCGSYKGRTVVKGLAAKSAKRAEKKANRDRAAQEEEHDHEHDHKETPEETKKASKVLPSTGNPGKNKPKEQSGKNLEK